MHVLARAWEFVSATLTRILARPERRRLRVAARSRAAALRTDAPRALSLFGTGSGVGIVEGPVATMDTDLGLRLHRVVNDGDTKAVLSLTAGTRTWCRCCSRPAPIRISAAATT